MEQQSNSPEPVGAFPNPSESLSPSQGSHPSQGTLPWQSFFEYKSLIERIIAVEYSVKGLKDRIEQMDGRFTGMQWGIMAGFTLLALLMAGLGVLIQLK